MTRQLPRRPKAEGLAEGKASVYQEIAAWNTRRLEAEAKGISPHKTERRKPHSEQRTGIHGFLWKHLFFMELEIYD